MPRTPLASRLSEAAAVAAESHAAGLTRRQLLASGAALAAAAALSRVPSARAAGNPRIAVIGAGLAGLSCAYDLKGAGYTAQVYEGSDRVGGRCWSYRDEAFADGQVAEHGGELIDQSHTEIRQLAQGLGLSLDNLLAAEANGTEPFYYFDGAPYTFAEATDDLKGIWQQIHMDVSAASFPTLYNLSTERGRELDPMSITDWINAYVPGGMASKLGQLLESPTTSSTGPSGACRARSTCSTCRLRRPGNLRIFGKSNEKYHVRGGNDQIPGRLAAALAGQITTNRALTAISRNADGTYSLKFSSGPAVTPTAS